MTPAHAATEETQSADMVGRTYAPVVVGRAASVAATVAARDLWLAVEMWFAAWLSRWSANPEHWVGVPSPAGSPVLPHAPLPHTPLSSHPWLFYLAVRDGLTPAQRRRLARRVAGALQWMRGRGGRWRVELFAGRARAWTVRNARRRRRWRAKTWVMSDKRGLRANTRPAAGHSAGISGTSDPPGVGSEERGQGKAERGPAAFTARTRPGTGHVFRCRAVPGLVPGPLLAGREAEEGAACGGNPRCGCFLRLRGVFASQSSANHLKARP